MREAGRDDAGQSKYSESELRDKSVGQLRRMCEEETAIEQRDIDSADEARDRKQAFSDLLLGVREAASGGGESEPVGSRTRGNTPGVASSARPSASGDRLRVASPEPELEPLPAAQPSRSPSSPSSSSKKKKKR